MKFEIAPKETEIQANWDDAKLYCSSLNIDGKKGWRLPTKEELNTIYNSENNFGSGRYCGYWSSTDYVGNAAWVQVLSSTGFQYDKGNSFYVRAVRDL